MAFIHHLNVSKLKNRFRLNFDNKSYLSNNRLCKSNQTPMSTTSNFIIYFFQQHYSQFQRHVFQYQFKDDETRIRNKQYIAKIVLKCLSLQTLLRFLFVNGQMQAKQGCS